MRINNPLASRPAYYDRTPLDASASSRLAAVAPHGLTTRITYTVPAGKKAFITFIEQRWRRVTAAAPVGIVAATLAGGSAYFVDLRTTLNAVDNIDAVSSGTQHVAPAGTVFLAQTSDAGTGGTCDYLQSFGIVEFDN